MSKKELEMVAISPEKANAQSLTCFIAFVVMTALAVILMIAAFVLPIFAVTTKIICWIAMGLEAIAFGFGCIANWINNNAL